MASTSAGFARDESCGRARPSTTGTLKHCQQLTGTRVRITDPLMPTDNSPSLHSARASADRLTQAFGKC